MAAVVVRLTSRGRLAYSVAFLALCSVPYEVELRSSKIVLTLKLKLISSYWILWLHFEDVP